MHLVAAVLIQWSEKYWLNGSTGILDQIFLRRGLTFLKERASYVACVLHMS